MTLNLDNEAVTVTVTAVPFNPWELTNGGTEEYDEWAKRQREASNNTTTITVGTPKIRLDKTIGPDDFPEGEIGMGKFYVQGAKFMKDGHIGLTLVFPASSRELALSLHDMKARVLQAVFSFPEPPRQAATEEEIAAWWDANFGEKEKV